MKLKPDIALTSNSPHRSFYPALSPPLPLPRILALNSQLKTLNFFNLLTAGLLFIGSAAQSAETPTLRAACKDHFYIGVAINRAIETGAAVAANNVSRTQEQVEKDNALVKEQFNQISPENDLK